VASNLAWHLTPRATQRPVIRNVGWDAREVKVVILSVPTKDLAPQTDHVDPS